MKQLLNLSKGHAKSFSALWTSETNDLDEVAEVMFYVVE
jgi:hypothetical protein